MSRPTGAEDLSRAWQQFVLERCREHGWKADNTSDLARVLRPVGTLNYKGVEKGFDAEPREVSLHHLDEKCRYTPESFEEVTKKQTEIPQGKSGKPKAAHREPFGSQRLSRIG